MFHKSPQSHYSGAASWLVAGQAASVTVQKEKNIAAIRLPPPIVYSFFLEQLQQA
jgi:hypothetical protein